MASSCPGKVVKEYLLDNREIGTPYPNDTKAVVASVKELEVLTGGAREPD